MLMIAARPINDRVIVKLLDAPRIDAAAYPTLAKLGIVAPDSTEEKETVCGTMIQYENAAHKGLVVAVGPGKWILKKCGGCGGEKMVRRPMSLEPGQTVVFGRFADYGEDGLLVIQEDDVLGILEADA